MIIATDVMAKLVVGLMNNTIETKRLQAMVVRLVHFT